MQRDFEIEVGKQKTVLVGTVTFTGENDTDCDGALVRFYVENVNVESIHTCTDEHRRCDTVEDYGWCRQHSVSPSREGWFELADKIASKNLDFLAILSK